VNVGLGVTTIGHSVVEHAVSIHIHVQTILWQVELADGAASVQVNGLNALL
jgi:hypothetical protein